MTRKDYNSKHQTSMLGTSMLIMAWIIAIILVSLLYNNVLFKPEEPKLVNENGQQSITLYQNYDYHYRVKGQINNFEVLFLLDTGATTVAISESVAKKANLPNLGPIKITTASGQDIGYRTKIDELVFGPFVVKNVIAVVSPQYNQDEVLLGMNVLQKFTLNQSQKALKITIPNPELNLN